jgi:CMP-N-acetylneuraminic acid synthetase
MAHSETGKPQHEVIGVVPIKSVSQRVQGKNFRPLGGRPLFHYILEAARQAGLDRVFVNTDDPGAAGYARANGLGVIDRPAYLSADSANGNDLLLYDASQVTADIYVQLFATAPFLSPATIRRAVSILKEDPECDSVFTVNAIYSWFWFDGRPVNYDPQVLPRSQDAKPVIRETTGLYAIRRESLLARRCRIGARPRHLVVDEIEGLDIDTEFDFRFGEFLLQSGRAKSPFAEAPAP